MRNSASLNIFAPDCTLSRLIAAFPRADMFFAAAEIAADTAAGELGARGLLVRGRVSRNAAAMSTFFCGDTAGVIEFESALARPKSDDFRFLPHCLLIPLEALRLLPTRARDDFPPASSAAAFAAFFAALSAAFLPPRFFFGRRTDGSTSEYRV